METLEDRFYNKAEDAALEIAKKANECCHRSDGYESDIKEFVLNKIKEIIDDAVDVCY